MSMKAVVWTKYGSPDGLVFKDVAKPTPKDHEVLIRIHATTVTAGDCEIRRSNKLTLFWLPLRLYFGIFKPRKEVILGQELSGEIEAVGKDVKLFKVGDQVFAAAGFGLGTYAEYKCLSEKGAMALKPTNMTYEEAAAVPLGGLEALYFLRKGEIQTGQKVLINGAGGSIGTFAVQLARYFGAEVTGVDRSGKLDMLRSIGADHVIDYTEEDFTKNGKTYDVIFDVIGKSSFSRSIQSLNPGGRFLLGNPGVIQRVRGGLISRRGNKKVIFWAESEQTEDLNYLKGMIEAGKIKSVIDKRYPLEQIAEAHRYFDTGEKKGNLVINVVYRNKI